MVFKASFILSMANFIVSKVNSCFILELNLFIEAIIICPIIVQDYLGFMVDFNLNPQNFMAFLALYLF